MKHDVKWLLLAGTFGALVLAQPGASSRFAVGANLGANLPAQPVGPGDLLAVSVYGAPELTRTVRVGSDGRIRLPMLTSTIDAKGRMPGDLEAVIADDLTAGGILVGPVVTVNVAEYASRPISVAGAVRRPLTFQAWGPTTLLEALTRAEGLSDEAGQDVLITKRNTDLPEPALRVRVKALLEGSDPAANPVLEGGEEIRVSVAGRVFVFGNVKKPGAYRVEETTGMTVLRALAMAEGLTPFSQKVAYIYRPGGDSVGGTRSPTPIPVELRSLLERKAPDEALQANDVLYIPDSRTQRTTASTLERIAAFVAGTTSGVLIYGVSH